MIRAFQWDLARQVERLDVLLKLLPRYTAWGYEELYLHLEDAVEYPSLPGIARADAYTYRELEKLVGVATQVGIKVVPIVNLLGHTQYLIKHADLRDLNELRAADGSPLERGQICPLHPRTPEVAEKLIRDMAPFCTAGKVHVGLDESFHLGKHPLSRAEVARIGLAAHFAGHVNRLREFTRACGLRMGMWADMLCFIPEAIPLLPRDLIAYDWYYYPFRRLPKVEMFNFKEYDLATSLQAHGIEYWGCPMNGSFRYEPLPIFGDRLANIQSWWRRCRNVNAAGMLITSWEANRLALEMTTVVDAAAASLWLNPSPGKATARSHVAMLAEGFARMFDATPGAARRHARAALACDEHAFAGYARWELNDRWDGIREQDSAVPFARGARFHGRLARATDLPAPFRSSAAFLAYLCGRDAFVRTAARGIYRLRRRLARKQEIVKQLHVLQAQAAAFSTTLTEGRKAARAMWRRTRATAEQSPNELILAADAARLKEWRRWLSRCLRTPAHAWETSVVVGAWQLEFVVHNFAPAVQRVIVEQQISTGEWRQLAARHTIEFKATAARARGGLSRTFAVPLESPDLPLRIVIGGIGQVGIGEFRLTDGVVARSATHAKKIIRLGQPAPRAGLPDPYQRGEPLALKFAR